MSFDLQLLVWRRTRQTKSKCHILILGSDSAYHDRELEPNVDANPPPVVRTYADVLIIYTTGERWARNSTSLFGSLHTADRLTPAIEY